MFFLALCAFCFFMMPDTAGNGIEAPGCAGGYSAVSESAQNTRIPLSSFTVPVVSVSGSP